MRPRSHYLIRTIIVYNRLIQMEKVRNVVRMAGNSESALFVVKAEKSDLLFMHNMDLHLRERFSLVTEPIFQYTNNTNVDQRSHIMNPRTDDQLVFIAL